MLVSRNETGFVTVSLTDNQQAVSQALDDIEAIDALHALPVAITPLTAAEARAAYDELHGDTLLAAGRSASRSNQRFVHALTRRASRLGLASRGEGQSEDRGPTSTIEGVWLEAVQTEGKGKEDDQVGSAAFSHDGQVLTLGFDGYWSDDVLVGLAVGQTTGDLSFSERRASGTQDGWIAGLYSRFESRSGVHFKIAVGAGQAETDMKRDIRLTAEKARSTITTSTVNLQLEGGFGLHVGNFGLRPFAMAGVQLLQRDGFRESGAAIAGLEVADEDNLLGEVGLGLELSRPWLAAGNRWAQLQGALTLIQPVGDDQLTQETRFAGATPSFTISDTPDDSPTLALNLGGEIYLTQGLALWGGYEGRVSSAADAHGLQLSLRYRW